MDVRMLQRICLFVLCGLGLSLGGCVGTLDIWGVNVGLPDGDDDDDDGPPDLDLSAFEGVEYLNIRWDTEQAEAGFVDCQEPFEVSGELLEDTEGCPSCDLVWAVDVELLDEDRPCLDQGTSLDPPEDFESLVGMNFRSENEFTMYRSSWESDDELLEQMGEGAFNGLVFTWSGVGGWEKHVSSAGYTVFFSGEGDF